MNSALNPSDRQSARPNDYSAYPDANGRFGDFGGRYVAETLMPLVLELGEAYAAAKADPAFQAEMTSFNTHYAGRPSPLFTVAAALRAAI